MTDDSGVDDPPTPAEARLTQLLEPLRTDPPRSEPDLAVSVVRSARWQSALRGALRAASQIAVAAGDVARLIIGRGPSQDER